jgi:hypothetical protein
MATAGTIPDTMASSINTTSTTIMAQDITKAKAMHTVKANIPTRNVP